MPNAVLPESTHRITAEFVNALSAIAADIVEGIYLTGSLTLDDFHPAKSDIDFLVLCKALPDDSVAAKIEWLHKKLCRRFPTPPLSGVYIAQETLHAPHPEKVPVLSWHNHQLRRRAFEMGPISLAELHGRAITLAGRAAQWLPIKTDPQTLSLFLYQNINTYWTRWIHNHFNRLLLICFSRLTEWAVLGVARQLYTLRIGNIVSKTEAGRYCLETLPQQFHPILRDAIRIRQDERTYPIVRSYAIRPSLSRAAQTAACVKYIIGLFNKTYEIMVRPSEKPESAAFNSK